MATPQKLKPCPLCGSDRLAIYVYDHGWRHVDCDECGYLGPGEGSMIAAARSHNAKAVAAFAEKKD